MSKKIDLTGQKFGKLTVIKYVGSNQFKHRVWECRCKCGNISFVETGNLTSGHTKSCGCTTKAFKHGKYKERIYKAWRNMKLRCQCKCCTEYMSYGGRGITYCKEWALFENFYEWPMSNGYQDNLTLDRINVNGNYEPENCRWITRQEQQFNKTNNRVITYNGKTQTLTEWAREIGVAYKTLSGRIDDYGWSIEKALTTPVKKYKRRCIAK